MNNSEAIWKKAGISWPWDPIRAVNDSCGCGGRAQPPPAVAGVSDEEVEPEVGSLDPVVGADDPDVGASPLPESAAPHSAQNRPWPWVPH